MKIKCECGGTMQPAKLTNVDLRPYFGLDAMARDAEGERCDMCGWETLTGRSITALRNQLAALILGIEGRLPPKFLFFLRGYLWLTQQELAKRMGVTRKTVSQWETKGGISPQHDLILRMLVWAQLEAASQPRPPASIFSHVPTGAAKVKGPLVLPGKAA